MHNVCFREHTNLLFVESGQLKLKVKAHLGTLLVLLKARNGLLAAYLFPFQETIIIQENYI